MTHKNEFLMGMFAAYMGCEVMDIRKNRIGKVVSINKIRVWYEHENSNIVKSIVQHFAFYAEIKPILTTLSEITDEDAVEVAKIFNEFVEDWGDIHCIKYGKLITKGIGKLPSPYLSKYIELTDYLRSPYRPDGTPKPVYDCGYMHIPSLISADLAISSKQI